MKTKQTVESIVTKRILAELEKGSVPWVKPWKELGVAGGGNIPVNHISNDPYHGINVLALWCAGIGKFESNRWLTKKQVLGLGGRIIYEEFKKSTEIIFWRKVEKKVKDENGDDADGSYWLLRFYNVYNVDQCVNLRETKWDKVKKEVPVVVSDPDGFNSEYEAAVRATGATIKHGGDRAFYIPSRDFIQLPHKNQFSEASQYEATTAHELTHWTGHKSRLDRLEKVSKYERKEYAFEELIGELGSAFTCAHFGINGDLRHAGYLDGYLKLLKDNPKAFISAARKAGEAVKFLYPKLEEVKVKEAA